MIGLEAMKMPTANGDNGRDERGRFTTGNPGGPGNPHAAQVSRLRSALLDAVAPEDMQAIALKLIDLAKNGDVMACRVLFDRVLGRPSQELTVEGERGTLIVHFDKQDAEL